jgi:hypothetical protein
MMKQLLGITIRPVWPIVRELRRKTGLVLADYSAELRTAASMAVSELVENAIKHGESVPAAPDIRFSMWARGGLLWIETINGSTDQAGVRELMDRVNEISSTKDRAALYVARLEQLLATPTERAKLGLYRVASEGECDLKCSYREQVVSITATREMS